MTYPQYNQQYHCTNSPAVLIHPGVGLTPTMAQHMAGTRPDPAVSVPKAKLHSPAATVTAAPDDEPPGMSLGSSGFVGGVVEQRVPTSPQANWSITVLPTTMPPMWGGH